MSARSSSSSRPGFVYCDGSIHYDTACGVPAGALTIIGARASRPFLFDPDDLNFFSSGSRLVDSRNSTVLASSGIGLDGARGVAVLGLELPPGSPLLRGRRYELLTGRLSAATGATLGGLSPSPPLRPELAPVLSVEGDAQITGALVVNNQIYGQDLVATGPKSPVDGSYPGGKVTAAQVEATTVTARQFILQNAAVIKLVDYTVGPGIYPQTVLMAPLTGPLTLTLAGVPPPGTRLTVKDYTLAYQSNTCYNISIVATGGLFIENYGGPSGTLRQTIDGTLTLDTTGGAFTLEYVAPYAPGAPAGWVIISRLCGNPRGPPACPPCHTTCPGS